jgi:hypothetical protein
MLDEKHEQQDKFKLRFHTIQILNEGYEQQDKFKLRFQ